ncbi:hypothetical protein CJ010_11380 [Azoarcus sp. DD4]|uniref:putative bifunctional diguanylate cyclase/phosphodiesterase n=1 Tax=Azoarcus sp. DD4 TaxID=2027405 RepID=UPI00112E4577|nr:bifunctional diguanylate cyclase/phosphodiesterase [Azoarcus sp. DD4]QDF97085.1 hypothetical protein CJ010_11380 [Azoarcus sp. DD4]
MVKRRVVKDVLRSAAEAQLPTAPAAPLRSAEALLHELQVHQIELEMQNEALRQAHVVLEESRDRYLSLFDFAPVGYLTLSRESMIVEANLMAATLLGAVRTTLGRRRFESFVAPDDLERWRRYFVSAWKGSTDEAFSLELNLLRQDNTVFPAQLQCAVKAVPGAAPVMRIAFNDISERRRLEEEQRIAAIAFESQEGMIVTDASGVIIRVNRAFTTLSGYSVDEAVGQTPALLSSGRHDQGFYQHLWQTLEAQRYWQGEIWNRRKDGSLYVAWLTISAVTTPEGRVSHYVGAFSDTTAKSEAAAEIHRLAFYDPLTLLPNRRLLQDRLGHALATAARSRLYGAILFLDLDNFKTLNDTRGHDVGDLLLVEVANRVRANLREGDTVARLGGDEFVMIVEGLSPHAEEAAVLAQQIGDKLNETIAQPFDLGSADFHCTTSIGARLMSGRETVDELLKHADLALYQAKADGRNTVRFYDPSMQAALDHRSLLECELRQALKLDQFQLHYQPQFDDADRIFGAEILLRWRHPSGALVSSGDFIPVSEQSELILPIGHWVLEAACEQLARWSRMERTRGLKLAVNVSARQFRQADFIDQVRDALERSQADPERLTLELTETMVLDNVADTIRKMQAIRQLGVHFSIDDFGTGFSSFAYLTRLMLDQIKIDRSFVLRLPDHPADAIIVSAIISMARSLGLDVLAEGVETEAQREFLLARGCHAYQGYLFGGPLPLADFEALVSAGGRALGEGRTTASLVSP